MASYDFIIVGGGTSGCTLAWRLANTKTKPSILLIEGGGSNEDISNRADGDRWISRLNPSLNWGFKSTAQEHLNNRIIDYDRGKGLGGSSAINFSVYSVGPRDDWDEIAYLTGDQDFAWENIVNIFKRLETFHAAPEELPDNAATYLNPDMKVHGQSGPLHVGFAKNWEPNLITMLDVCQDAGIKLNHDMNSGDPIGISVCPSSASHGLRSTAADFIKDKPSNLTILTDTQVEKVLLDGNKCIGVQIPNSHPIHANREVILSAGALDSPKILLHSGIGPASQLSKFAIKQHVNLPGVGASLRDHHHAFLTWERTVTPSSTLRRDFLSNPAKQSQARAQWTKDHSGPLADIGTALGIAWLKNQPILTSPEFSALPNAQKSFLKRSTIPYLELAVNPIDPEYFTNPSAPPLLTMMCLPLNTQSAGNLALHSHDPTVPLLFNPNFLAHPFDRRAAIESVREGLRIASSPLFTRDTVSLRDGPAGTSDEEILEWWREKSMSTWHMCATLPMGPEGSGKCVDPGFRVMGTEGLRVVDASVLPILPNAHVQAYAYALGVVGGDKMGEEWGLDL